MDLNKNYSPAEIEDRLYKKWEEAGYFHAQVNREKEPFTIVIPPPNITGNLHMGHAFDNTLQDILIRYKKMQGYETLWQPGTDHAAIATEVKIVEKMKEEEGLTKEDIGRQAFMEKAWKWKEEYGGIIIDQLKKLGSACDWERERFTLDEGCSKAVMQVFEDYYKKGYIYKGDRIVNWCPYCETSISDAEVEYEEKPSNLWHIKYPIKDSDKYIEVATTRPETMLGDTAIAVNPLDERYKELVGRTAILPLVGREIIIVADEYVDKDFGTGAVKITPGHDPNDFEIGLRHKLEIINILTDDGHINENGGKYQALSASRAREKIIEDLEKEGFLVSIEDYTHNVGLHDRCKSIIEPMVKLQWFVKMEDLAKPAIKALKDGKLKFVPERYGKIYLHWLENIKDWCISRQLWWGHRIPAYYCESCDHITVSKDRPSECQACGSKKIYQDEDSLDTWFSSALWPFSTLGWPEKTAEFDYFFPTNVLVTGYDIIFFWVVRMVFSSLELTGKLPFDTVVIHGLVRDSKGRKMSKSLGNGIDPLKIIDKYGADALRFTLVTGNAAGNDMRYSEEKVIAARNFANKLWNASRFIIMNMDPEYSNNIQIDIFADENFESRKYVLNNLRPEDKWILSNLNSVIKEIDINMDKYELGMAVDKASDFAWNEFCDWYIEMVKTRLYSDNETSKKVAIWTLRYLMVSILKLVHPFMPFVTEELFMHLQKEEDSIMVTSWPIAREELSYPQEEKSIGIIKEAIHLVRNLRGELQVPPKKKVDIILYSAKEEIREIFKKGDLFFTGLAYADKLNVVDIKPENLKDYMSLVIADGILYLPADELINKEKEIARLAKEKERIISEIKRAKSQLNNTSFVEKAPKKLVEETRHKKEEYEKMLTEVESSLSRLV